MITSVFVEQPLALELAEQPTELFIEESDAIVVAVAGHQEVPLRRSRLVHRDIIEEELGNPAGPRAAIPKRPANPGGGTNGSWASK